MKGETEVCIPPNMRFLAAKQARAYRPWLQKRLDLLRELEETQKRNTRNKEKLREYVTAPSFHRMTHL